MDHENDGTQEYSNQMPIVNFNELGGGYFEI